MSQKELGALIRMRERIYAELVNRRALGGFDTNADTILLLLDSFLSMINYQVVLANKKKPVATSQEAPIVIPVDDEEPTGNA